MDDPISIIAQEMETRYNNEKGKINEAEKHNYTTGRDIFTRELSAYFQDKPYVIHSLATAINQHRDPFALVDNKSRASNEGRAHTDPRLATASDKKGTPENTPHEALTQTPPAESNGLINYPPSAYCCMNSSLNPDNVDINAVGILYEFRNQFFVVFQSTLANNREFPVLRYGFVAQHAIGRYLKIEWEMLENCPIGLGNFGTGALGTGAGKKEWNVHSAKIQRMRAVCFETAKEVALWLTSKEKPDLSLVEDHVIKSDLERAFIEKMKEVDAEWRLKERKNFVDAEKFMEEFMVFEE
ncbi:hypothetical protein PTMSG1_05524 [Pyrenophora teres f. maculata]|nr:hypothetical protein PTMSG1_05524 [Pyrenophora teres f. maculata]